MAWYYEVNRQQRGPVTDSEFASLVAAGTVRAETLVWQEGWPDWRAYGTVAGAAPAGTPTGFAGDDADTAVCAVSGRRLPKRDMLEFEGRWVSAEHKEEFFQRLREGVSQPTEMVYASFGRRFGAKLIDGIIVGAANAAINALLGLALIGSVTATNGNQGVAMIVFQVLSQLSGIVLAIGYALYFIRKQDATPGKKVLGLRLVRADGSKLSKGRIIGRYFAELVSALILGIGYFMAAFDKEQRRALHDRMCDTRVIDVRGS